MKETLVHAAKQASNDASFSATYALQSSFVMTMTGLGITIAFDQFIGGLVMALAGAAVARSRDPAEDKGFLWPAIGTALFFAIVAAMVMSYLQLDWPFPLVAVVVGWMSRPIALLLFKVRVRTEERSEELADKVIDRVSGEGQ